MTAPQSSLPSRRWYHKKRTYFASLVGLAAIMIISLVVVFHFAPFWLVERVLRQTGAPASIPYADWTKDGALELKSIRVPGGGKETAFLQIEALRLKWNWFDLLFRQRVARVEIDKPQVWIAKMNAAMEKSGNSGGGFGKWSIGYLKITSGTVTLDNLGADVPPVPIMIGAGRPLELHDIHLASGMSSNDREQTATVENLTIVSPYDPMSPVLFFKAINITFTWEELLNSDIRRVEMIGPVIYLGPDLFQFTDHFSKKRDDSGAKQSLPWKIREFQVRAGQLAINVFGQPGVTLPFTFVSRAKDIRLDQLDKISIRNKILIPPQDRSYPEYKVRWEDLEGEIAFSLPLGASADNLVNTIKVKMISWNDLQVTDAWSSVTFDRNGIYGRMEGHCYRGYLSSDFAIYFKNGFPWEGHFFAQGVDSSPMVTKLAPSYLSLSGILDGKLNVKGLATEISRSTGDLKLRAPGLMEIKSIDDLIKKMPDDWGTMKRDLVTILLQAFRTYNYTKGELSLDYEPPTAVGALRLSGLQGERNFTVRWHHGQHSSEVANSKTKR